MGFIDQTPQTSERLLPTISSPSIVPDAAAPEDVLAAEMAAHLNRRLTRTGAEALRELRRAFPDAPLPARVMALRLVAAGGNGRTGHIPR